MNNYGGFSPFKVKIFLTYSLLLITFYLHGTCLFAELCCEVIEAFGNIDSDLTAECVDGIKLHFLAKALVKLYSDLLIVKVARVVDDMCFAIDPSLVGNRGANAYVCNAEVNIPVNVAGAGINSHAGDDMPLGE